MEYVPDLEGCESWPIINPLDSILSNRYSAYVIINFKVGIFSPHLVFSKFKSMITGEYYSRVLVQSLNGHSFEQFSDQAVHVSNASIVSLPANPDQILSDVM